MRITPVFRSGQSDGQSRIPFPYLMTNCLPRDSLIGLDKFHVLRVILVLNLLDKAAVVLNVVNGYAIIVSTEVLLEELLFLFAGPVIRTGH